MCLNVQLAMVNPRRQVIHKLRAAQFVDKVGRERIFLTIGDAINACGSAKFVGP